MAGPANAENLSNRSLRVRRTNALESLAQSASRFVSLLERIEKLMIAKLEKEK